MLCFDKERKKNGRERKKEKRERKKKICKRKKNSFSLRLIFFLLLLLFSLSNYYSKNGLQHASRFLARPVAPGVVVVVVFFFVLLLLVVRHRCCCGDEASRSGCYFGKASDCRSLCVIVVLDYNDDVVSVLSAFPVVRVVALSPPGLSLRVAQEEWVVRGVRRKTNT